MKTSLGSNPYANRAGIGDSQLGQNVLAVLFPDLSKVSQQLFGNLLTGFYVLTRLRHTTNISSGRAVLVSSLTIRDSKLRMFVGLRSVLCNPFFDRPTNPRQHCNAAALRFRSRDFRQLVGGRRVDAVDDVTTPRLSILF
jgi:hypothetical protein